MKACAETAQQVEPIYIGIEWFVQINTGCTTFTGSVTDTGTSEVRYSP